MNPTREEVYVSETGYDFTKKGFDINTVLSGHRVSQMTKTFADVDALQKLLEEKERDLELAARIGQQLLEQNQSLGERVTTLEQENKECVENITQLKHELNCKIQLLEIYNDDPTESSENSKAATPVGSISAVATVLERRLQTLENENKSLREEACQLAADVDKTEAEEKYLVEDALKNLAESNKRLTKTSDELFQKSEQLREHQEEISVLEEELKVFQATNNELFNENVELHKLIEAFRTNQNELATELLDLKDNYVEVVSILKETQEQLREAQKKKEEGADVVTVFDSLAYEIDASVARQRRSSDYFRRTFDTVRCANSKMTDALLASSALMSSASSSGYQSNSSGLPSLDSSSSHEMMMSSNFNSLVLESGLGSSLCHSPGGSSTPGSSWRLPEKLQIVKPLEGSSTLQIWSALATPHLGNLLDKRPGVKTRVERPIMGEIGLQTVLELTNSEPSTLIVSTPAFTFVTSSSHHHRRDSTTTIFSGNMSTTVSTYSLSSVQSPLDALSPISTSTVTSSENAKSNIDFHPNDKKASSQSSSSDYLKACDTPQNSPMEGNSRPASPSFRSKEDDSCKASSSRTLKTLYSVYDTLCSKLGGLGSPSRAHDYAHPPQKYDLTTKIGRVEVSFESSRIQAPPKPGTGALEKILLEPD